MSRQTTLRADSSIATGVLRPGGSVKQKAEDNATVVTNKTEDMEVDEGHKDSFKETENSLRYDIRLNVPASSTPDLQLAETLQSFFMKAKELLPSLSILPWSLDSTDNGILSPGKMPAWCEVSLPHGPPRSSFSL